MPETFSYKLVNPYIIGSMETTFKGGNSLEAANQAYKELSQYMGNSMPEFQFSLKKMSKDGKVGGGSENSFRHFQVHEKKEGGSNISYSISEIEMNPKVDIKHFQESLNKVANQDAKLNGGGKKKYVKGNDYEDDDDNLSDYFDRDDRPRKDHAAMGITSSRLRRSKSIELSLAMPRPRRSSLFGLSLHS